MGFFGLGSSESYSTTTSNTTNINNSRSQTTNTLGLTGNDLANFLAASGRNLDTTFAFSTYAIGRANDTLNAVTVAANDVSARAIAGGTGQTTPISEDSGLKQNPVLNPNLILLFAGIAVAYWATK